MFFALKYFGNDKLKLGLKVVLQYRTRIWIQEGRVIIGDNVLLRSDPRGYHGAMAFPTTLYSEGKEAIIEIGNDSRLNGVFVHAKSKIEIGKGCLIASGVNLIDTNGHLVRSLSGFKDNCDDAIPISIGNNVSIGINSLILKGTKIGENSVVSANSVVNGVFPSNSLIIGNPAVKVKNLKF